MPGQIKAELLSYLPIRSKTWCLVISGKECGAACVAKLESGGDIRVWRELGTQEQQPAIGGNSRRNSPHSSLIEVRTCKLTSSHTSSPTFANGSRGLLLRLVLRQHVCRQAHISEEILVQRTPARLVSPTTTPTMTTAAAPAPQRCANSSCFYPRLRHRRPPLLPGAHDVRDHHDAVHGNKKNRHGQRRCFAKLLLPLLHVCRSHHGD